METSNTPQMSPMFQIIILGKPISKDNQARGRSWAGKFFTRPKYRAFESDVRRQAGEQWQRGPLLGALEVNIQFYFPNRTRVDLLNAPKSICDALNNLVWKDDKQIEEARLTVLYDQFNPRSEIQFQEIGSHWAGRVKA